MDKPVETMMLDALRDELATLLGWRVISESDIIQRTSWMNERHGGCPVSGRTILVSDDGMDVHPIPATLDFIAACLPKGWNTRVYSPPVPGRPWWCEGDRREGALIHHSENAYADTEILARARLAVACHRAQKQPGAHRP